ncbi:MAG TPA: YciI family protein, partial [Coleofasciculaceae cyanobacterium]
RTEHLRYIEAHKEQIFCGGPTLDDHGNSEMMLIILDAPDLASAEAFIQVEPYNRSGVFERITIRQWRQILPESHPGELLQQIQNH